MKRLSSIIAALLFAVTIHAGEEQISLATPTGNIHGRLMLPDSGTPCPVVLIIAGSGPTDMNGNSIGTPFENNSLKMLAEGLAANGIASVRYDKRGIGESAGAAASEDELRFGHYIDDAAAWAEMLGNDKRFTSVTIAGHSEGSLIGMVAAQKSSAVDFYISIAGCGRPAYEVIEEQLKSQPEQIQREAAAINSKLRDGHIVDDVPNYLTALYRKSVQPYLISWFCYDPAKEIAKLRIPVLILQGNKDIQVSVKESEKLYMARIFSSYQVIENMNHILKHCESTDQFVQLQNYQDPKAPVKSELIECMARFILAQKHK